MGCPPVLIIIHLLKLVDNLHVQADSPWYNLYAIKFGFFFHFYCITLCKAIKIQRHDENPAAIPRNGTCGKQVKNEFIEFTFCCIVKRIEGDVDWKLFSIIERTTVRVLFPRNSSVWTMAVDQRCQNRTLFYCRRQNASQKHISW